MVRGIPKTWALSISNIGVALTVLAALLLTGSAWVLVGLVLMPLNLFVWQYTRRGIMVVEYDDEHDVEVVFTTEEKESDNCTGSRQSGAGGCCGAGRTGSPPAAA